MYCPIWCYDVLFLCLFPHLSSFVGVRECLQALSICPPLLCKAFLFCSWDVLQHFLNLWWQMKSVLGGKGQSFWNVFTDLFTSRYSWKTLWENFCSSALVSCQVFLSTFSPVFFRTCLKTWDEKWSICWAHVQSQIIYWEVLCNFFNKSDGCFTFYHGPAFL